MNREQAYELLTKYNKTQSLVMHGLSVEAVMRHFADKHGEDVNYWGIVGLLHDLDYEMYPESHCHKSKEILESEGVEAGIVRAVMSHGYGICTDIAPEHLMEKVLYTTDELTGLITAAVYMRPSKSVLDLEVKSIKKKFKTPSFAAGVNREVILKGCEMLGMELDEVIQWTIDGMKAAAHEIGLAGELG